MENEKLDKNSPIPLYFQLYAIILNDIKNGVFKPGDMLPTEQYMVDHFEVSRATVRQAVLDLARQGYVIREKSKGTFVKDPNATLSYKDKVTGFSAVSALHGRVELTSKVLEHKVIKATAFLCEPLGIEPGTEVFYLKRVRSIEGKPAVYTEDWMAYDFCKGIEEYDFMDKSLHTVLIEQYNKIPHHAVRTFDCCKAENEEQMQELKVSRNEPLLRFTSSVYDADNKPIEYCLAVIHGKYTVYE